MKSIVCVLLVLSVLLCMTACGNGQSNPASDDDTPPTEQSTETKPSSDDEQTADIAMTVDGVEINKMMYTAALYQAYYSIYYTQVLYQYGTDVWTQEFPYGDDQTELLLEDYIIQLAKDNLIRQVAVQKMMTEYGIAVDEKDLQEQREEFKDVDEQDMLKYGFDKEAYLAVQTAILEEQALFYTLYGEGGARAVPAEDVREMYDILFADDETAQMDDDNQKRCIFELKYDEFDAEVKALMASFTVEHHDETVDLIKPKGFLEIDNMNIEDEKDPVEYEGDLRLVDEDGNEWIMTDHVEKAIAMWEQDSSTGEIKPAVNVTFDENGTKKFAEATRKNQGRILYIYAGDELVSAPTVNVAIDSGEVVISVTDYEEAKRLAEILDVVG